MKRSDYAAKRRLMAQRSIDELIELLASDDLETRFFAEMCLRDATSVWLNFRPASSPVERAAAIEEWRAWLAEREGKFKKRLRRSAAERDKDAMIK